MIKRIKKIGNGNALFLDKAILEMIGLAEGGQIQLTVHDGSIIITPTYPKPVDKEQFAAAMEKVVGKRRQVLRRLAE